MSDVAYIDNIPYKVIPNETILNFIRRNIKDDVPTLCDDDNLKPFGSCRICSVEASSTKDGNKNVVASCHTPLISGQYIYPHTSKIKRMRRNILELILSDHNYDCDNCSADKNCKLQSVVEDCGIKSIRYIDVDNHKKINSEDDHPYMRSNLSQCINCYRCIRACDEIQGQFALGMKNRGFKSQVIKGKDTTFSESECVSCGACSQTCPTNAIADVFQTQLPDDVKTTRTTCVYCGVGCNLDVVSANDQIFKIDGTKNAKVNQAHTCLKGRYAFKYYNHPDRLNSPMIRKDGKLENVSWDEAYDYIEQKFRQLIKNYGPDSIGGISSSRCTNEENYLMQKFMRAVLKTNNIDGCSRVCHSPTALGMQKIFGVGAATNSIADIQKTECMMVIGANPTFAHPVTGAKIKQKSIKGCPLIVIDPYKTELAEIADIHLQLRPGTNIAVFNMILYYIITDKLADDNFISLRTEGYDEFKKEVLSMDIDDLSVKSGVSKSDARAAAHMYSMAKCAMSFHGLGVTENSQGTTGVMLIAQLALITGNIGKEGAGVNPLRGQNNVQGMADMGAQPYQGAGYLDVTDPINNALYTKVYNTDVPMTHGLKTPEMIEKALTGELKAMWVIGQDLSQTDPNVDYINDGLVKLDMLIVQDIFMNETSKYAHVVLPASSFFEKSGTFTNGERRVQRVNQVIPPLKGTKTDGQIIMEMMNRFGYPQKDYHPKEVLKEIAQIVPFFKGITWENLQGDGKQWPVAEDGTDTKILHQDTFKIGKGQFIPVHFEETEEVIEHQKEFPLILTTVRNLEHYNGGGMTRRTGNLEIIETDILVINPEDAKKYSIKDDSTVKVSSDRGSTEIKAKISEDVMPGILSSTFHFPDIMINRLTSNTADSEAVCPEYKVTCVKVAPA